MDKYQDDVADDGLDDFLHDDAEVRARQRDEARQAQYLEDVREIVGTPAGQRFFTNLLGVLGVHSSIWSDGPHLSRDCALKDLGDELLNDVAEVDEEAFIIISRAVRLRARD